MSSSSPSENRTPVVVKSDEITIHVSILRVRILRLQRIRNGAFLVFPGNLSESGSPNNLCLTTSQLILALSLTRGESRKVAATTRDVALCPRARLKSLQRLCRSRPPALVYEQARAVKSKKHTFSNTRFRFWTETSSGQTSAAAVILEWFLLILAELLRRPLLPRTPACMLLQK